MRDSSALPKEFETLKERTDAHRRGFDFQPFVGKIFQAQHFRVEKKARAAMPRQVDLFATRGDEVYLIETKWRQDPANIDDIDSLFTRLVSCVISSFILVASPVRMVHDTIGDDAGVGAG